MAEPKSYCGGCEQTDDHPKHDVLVGFNNTYTSRQMFHDHDTDRDGVIHYHFDCPTPFHAAVHAEHHQRLAALATSGVRGAKLRERIVAGDV